MRDEQMHDSFIEREVWSIIMQDHHIDQKALMLRVKAFIWHVKGLGHYTLGDSNRHPKTKVLITIILFISILQSSIGEENTKKILMHRILGVQI